MNTGEELSGMTSFAVRLGGAIALFVALFSGLPMAYSVIDYFLPEMGELDWHSFYYTILGGLPVQISFFVVALVALLVVHHFAHGIAFSKQENLWRILSRVVVVGVLLVSVIIIAVAGAILLTSVLGGDVDLNNLMKLVLTGAVGGGVFYYYLRLHRGSWVGKERGNERYVFTATALSFAFVIVGVGILDPLNRNNFEDTLQKLSALQYAHDDIHRFYKEEGRLPESLDALHTSDSDGVYPAYRSSKGEREAREEREALRYAQLSATKYMMCAKIATAPRGATLPGYPYAMFPMRATGEPCFTVTVSTSKSVVSKPTDEEFRQMNKIQRERSRL